MGTSFTVAFYVDWNNDWALHHYNAPSHTAMAVQQFFAKKSIPIVPHASYSSDLAPRDFWLFPTLKMGLRGRRFATVDYIKGNADARLRAIKKDFHQCYNN
jgi:hypothetical protein